MSSWLEKTGAKGFETKMESFKKNPTSDDRFFMAKGTEKQIIFLTDEPTAIFFEHSPKIGKSFRNFVTCDRYIKEACKLCIAGNNPYQVAAFTVIDCTGYTDRDGKLQGVNKKCLFMAKQPTFEKLMRQYKRRVDKGETLRGAVYTVSRGTADKSPNIGDDFEFEGMADLSQLKDSVEFDYEKLFAPDEELMDYYTERFKATGSGGTGSSAVVPPTGTAGIKY